MGKLIHFAEIVGEIYKFCGNRGEYTICIIDLGGTDNPDSSIAI